MDFLEKVVHFCLQIINLPPLTYTTTCYVTNWTILMRSEHKCLLGKGREIWFEIIKDVRNESRPCVGNFWTKMCNIYTIPLCKCVPNPLFTPYSCDSQYKNVTWVHYVPFPYVWLQYFMWFHWKNQHNKTNQTYDSSSHDWRFASFCC